MANFDRPLRYPLSQRSVYTDSRFPGERVHAEVKTMANIGLGRDVKTGSINSDWKYEISRGTDASTYYLRKGGSATPGRMWCEVEKLRTPISPYAIVGNDLANRCAPMPSSLPSTSATLADIALARVKRRLRDKVGDMNLIVPLAELKDLRKTISGTAGAATDLVNTLVNIKRTKGRSAAKYASKAWLNFNFGVAPLVKETRDISKSIAEYLLRQDQVTRCVGTASDHWVTGMKHSSITGSIGSTVEGTSTLRHSLGYQYIAGTRLALSAGNDYDAFSHFRVGLGALPSVAWELTPYSWIVDYFTTAGAFFDDIFYAHPGQMIYVIETRKYTCYAESQLSYKVNPGFLFQGTSVSKSSWDYYEFERRPLPSLPHASLRFRTFDEMGLNGVKKLLNLASLLGSRIS